MASGVVHDRWVLKTLPLAGFFGGLCAHATGDAAAFAIPLGHLLGLLLSPDLDLRTRTRAERRLMRLPLLTWPLLVMSTGYAIVFGGGRWPFVHRGISHWPIVGTLTRWVFFGAPLVLLLIATGNESALASVWPALFWAFVGNCLSDFVHVALDAA